MRVEKAIVPLLTRQSLVRGTCNRSVKGNQKDDQSPIPARNVAQDTQETPSPSQADNLHEVSTSEDCRCLEANYGRPRSDMQVSEERRHEEGNLTRYDGERRP
jgi:hypothetical protein